jgi:hypothetical protein
VRMIVLLQAYNLGFTAWEVAIMFTAYELAGVFTNLAAGMMGERCGRAPPPFLPCDDAAALLRCDSPTSLLHHGFYTSTQHGLTDWMPS